MANRSLATWQATACSVLQESWRALLGNELEIEIRRTDTVAAFKGIQQLADPGYAARMQLGPDGSDALFCFSTRMLLSLVSDMLGTGAEEWPEVRELTVVETSMVELLFGEIARAVSQAWPEVERLACDLHSVMARPLRSRLYPPEDVLVRTELTLRSGPGEETAVWLIPQATLITIGIADSGEETVVAPAPQLRQIAEHLPVEVTVQLGDTSMKLEELDKLRVGDYLTLDQSVVQPLEMTVDGRLHWLGHPCRLGTRQGFEIVAAKGPDR